jgi:hypothetical protein
MVPKATYDLAMIDGGMRRKTASCNQHPTALRTDATRELRRAVSTTVRVNPYCLLKAHSPPHRGGEPPKAAGGRSHVLRIQLEIVSSATGANVSSIWPYSIGNPVTQC